MISSKKPVLIGLVCVVMVTCLGSALYARPSTPSPQGTESSEFTGRMAVVLGLVGVLIFLFVWEPIRLDLLSLTIPVVLMILQPWTRVSTEEGLSGFSSTATITVLAMFVISDGIRRTGVVQILGDKISDYFTGSETRQLAMVTGLTGSVASFINNTPVVAIFVPMVTRLARKAKTSPSKLLIPLSYASMLGGTMTLLGTSTNLLASDISAQLLNHPFSMFEFTQLGLLVLLVGIAYLLTVGRWLVPERIEPDEKLTEEYEMNDFLTEIVVDESSPFVGQNISEVRENIGDDLEIAQVRRDGEQFMEPLDVKTVRPDDHLVIRAEPESLLNVREVEGLKFLHEVEVTEKQLEEPIKGQKLIEVVIPQGSFAEGEDLEDVNFVDRYDATVMAIRRGEELTHRGMQDLELNAGDVLLLLSTERTKERLRQNPNFILARQMEASDYRRSKTFQALGILTGVVTLAALGILPIVVSALAGVVGMIVTGCVEPNELYDAVDWEVIFLLAGLIPLGVAMQKTGTAQWLAQQILEYGEVLPTVALLAVFYLFTAFLTNIISNNASVVLMIPVAVDAARQIGAEPFSFVLACTFAASTAFMSPVGYQTNLMVYGPGGYKFRDFVIVGAPLQLLLAVVTPFGILYFWGV